MKSYRPILLACFALVAAALACSTLNQGPLAQLPRETAASTPVLLPGVPTAAPARPGSNSTPSSPSQPPQAAGPTTITGKIPFTSRFFLNTTAEPFVLLEDEAGFVQRDQEFQFPLASQVIGPVEMQSDGSLTYHLELPEVPQATQVDVDNNGKKDAGVQVFAIAYWSNTWGGPFLEERDGTGWSNAYASTITDPDREFEISGGTLLIWSPDAGQSFPTGFGADKKLFTADDPVAAIPAGYSLVNMDQEPFRFSKDQQPVIDLIEGPSAVNDYSNLSYGDAFEKLFAKVSLEYPFTQEKGVNWQALHDQFASKAASARSDTSYYQVIRDFMYAIPDNHIGLNTNNQAYAQVFYQEHAGGFGLVLAQLSDGSLIARQVLPGTPASRAGIKAGAVISSWDGKPVAEAIAAVVPDLGHSYSTDWTRRLAQVAFLPHVPPDTQVTITFQNPGESQPKDATLRAEVEVESLVQALSGPPVDPTDLPVEGHILDSGIAYLRIDTFDDDYNLMARLWERFIKNLIDNKVPGLIIDLRYNGGGSGGLALDFAGYLFNNEIDLYRNAYYNTEQGKFVFSDYPDRIKPAPVYYDGKVAILVTPDCVSACEGFAYALSYQGRSTVVGSYPTAGAFGEVGRGQYRLPGGIDLQFPTGRPETMDGKLVIEGQGVKPDVTVPVTAESVLGQKDTILQAAIDALQK